MSIIDLYQAFGVAYQTEGHKHCRPGWVNTTCPFCTGNEGYHLGVHIGSGHAYCWRCGWKPIPKVLCKILNISESRARELARTYHIKSSRRSIISSDRLINFQPFKIPSDCHPLQLQHKKYLVSRNFDPEKIVKEWGIQGTGPVSYLDGIDYRHRIFIPIIWEGKMVSFQTRDITGKSDLKYISCPKAREVIQHKHILYGKDWNRKVGIAVEGVTDVWRLGPAAFAVFGIEFLNQQVRQMAKLFKRVIVLFDDDPQAIRQAAILMEELKFRKVDAAQEIIKGDPGEMSPADADYLVKQLIT